MNKTKVWLWAAAVLAATTSLVAASEPTSADAPKPGVVEAVSVTLTGTVENIDYNTRMLTLKGKDGKTVDMEVGPEAARFNEVKKGDTVKIDYLESVAVMVSSPDEKVASAEGSSQVIVRNKTQRPSGMAVATDVVSATVVKINAEKRTAVLRGPKGNEFKVDIAPDVPHVKNIKKGDIVLVKYTRTMAVAVSSTPKS